MAEQRNRSTLPSEGSCSPRVHVAGADTWIKRILEPTRAQPVCVVKFSGFCGRVPGKHCLICLFLGTTPRLGCRGKCLEVA